GYSVAALPVIRNMIDSLYNVTAILQNPSVNGPWFRKSGFKKLLTAMEDDEARYGGKPEWDDWVKKGRTWVTAEIRKNGLTEAEVMATKEWPTLGKYALDKQTGGIYTPHQNFLQTFILGPWREYSALAHGGFEGLSQLGLFFVQDALPHEVRPKVEE